MFSFSSISIFLKTDAAIDASWNMAANSSALSLVMGTAESRIVGRYPCINLMSS